MTKVQLQPTRQTEENRYSLGALKVTLGDITNGPSLDLISISRNKITVRENFLKPLEDNSEHTLEFSLHNSKWRQSATFHDSPDSHPAFTIKTGRRPQPDSRLAKRWPAKSSFPITARIQNNISGGQWITCAVENISIGGAKLQTECRTEFIQGQIGRIEIHYPLQLEASIQTFEISNIMELDDLVELNVRFNTITSSHIQSIAQHLIRFEWEHRLSELELDLSDTQWPKERVTNVLVRDQDSIVVQATIAGENIAELRANLDSDSVLVKDISTDPRWPKGIQTNSLLIPLIDELLANDISCVVSITGDHKAAQELGFTKPEGRENNWELQLNRSLDFREKKAAYHGNLELNLNRDRKRGTKRSRVSWDQYGLVYDKMCEVNSSYQQLLAHYDLWLRNIPSEVRRAVDLGAGTGNFVARTADVLPDADLVHVDQDVVMNLFAQSKYRKLGIENVRIKTCRAENFEENDESLDLVTAVHSLYTLDDPAAALQRIHGWLKVGGFLYVVDIGRTINTNEWSRHIFSETAKKRGILSTAKYFWDAKDAIKANKRIEATQNSGEYWTKSHQEFLESLENAGFKIEHSETIYRGNSDLAICRKI